MDFNRSSSNPLAIAHHLFMDGEEIKDLVIPNSVTSIGGFAFYGCSGLTSVTFSNSVKDIGGCSFEYCSGLNSISFGNNVTSIGVCAFSYCSGLSSVNIPNTVTSIGSVAFMGCSKLTTITIGNSVNIIGSYSFADCPELTDVFCYAEDVPIMKNFDNGKLTIDAFSGSYIEYAILHVPTTSVSIYQSTEPWKNFKEVIPLTDSDPQPTGIRTTDNNLNKPNKFYDLSGRGVEHPQKGVYITKGKKVLTK
jgi:hypothetical protein